MQAVIVSLKTNSRIWFVFHVWTTNGAICPPEPTRLCLRFGRQPGQQFAIWPGTQETARSEIAPYPEIIAKRGVYEVGRALRARRSV